MTEGVGAFPSASQAVSEDGAGVVVLVFRMDGREHALPVQNVVEVLRMVAAMPLPEAPPWVYGVINFRGRVIPLIDLRSRLGAPRREPDLSTPIIVVQANEMVAGLMVDEVVDVLTLRSEAVDAPVRVPPAAPGSAVSGVARRGDRLLLLLEPGHLCESSVDLRLPLHVEEIRESVR
jgi:purine-binding chemotaxis protein CheW